MGGGECFDFRFKHSFIHSTKTYWMPAVFQAVLDPEERGNKTGDSSPSQSLHSREADKRAIN